ncbi:PREDICTED: uncharacterized protein LOC105149714 [Acromyrmex echinatior]|uniref:uncharacterized protein LOC105149714 n=1 Tax=Acromyrmex echinatior TaxID=103372 RepID=UPI000580C656|nr:PREDICTED: uncharacterized protein LOC105149714 [Acromyrmex echinatior]
MDLNQDQGQSTPSTVMPMSYEEMIRQLNEAQMELKIRYEQASKLAIDCAKLQLEYLKLYKPQLLQILEELQDISASVDADSVDPPNDGDGIESRDNQGNEVLRADEDVSRKSMM